jgi:GxxExxY protein
MDTDDKRFDWITERIIGLAFKVGNVLGHGFLEKCYENALVHELRKAGLQVEQQFPIDVWYDGIVVGQYFADILVEGVVVVELKAINGFEPVHSAQLINYLFATQKPVGLLINFGKRVEVKRLAGPTLSSSVPIRAPSVANPLDSNA